MTRFIAPKGMKELGINTSRGTKVLKQDKDGTFHVTNPKLAKKLREEGLGVAGVAPVTSLEGVGYNCKKCGFGSYFKQCSRCGELNG